MTTDGCESIGFRCVDQGPIVHIVRKTLLMVVMMLTVAATTGSTGAGPQPGGLSPATLAIYYGYPSLVNGASGNIERAVATFAEYDVVVFGDGLEFSDVDPRRSPRGAGPDEHRRTRAIIERLRSRAPAMRVYGYIDLGNSQQLSIADIQQRTRLWAAVGATGIFLDEAGYDFGVTRERQNTAIDAIHGLGLSAFVNAFNPDDVFSPSAVPLNSVGGGNPTGLATRLGQQDVFLLESFQVRLGRPEAWSAWSARTAKAVGHRERHRTRIFAVTTTTAETARQAAGLYGYAWWSAAVWGLDGVGWGEPDFSGVSSQLPPRHRDLDRRALAGTRFVSPVAATPDGYERRTDAGRVVLSRTSRSGWFERTP